jgi:hypothetical protein
VTRDYATNPHVGDVWQDRHGVTMTVTALQVGHLTTPDVVTVVTVDIDGYHFDFTPGQFANPVTAAEFVRSAEDAPCPPDPTSASPSPSAADAGEPSGASPTPAKPPCAMSTRSDSMP